MAKGLGLSRFGSVVLAATAVLVACGNTTTIIEAGDAGATDARAQDGAPDAGGRDAPKEDARQDAGSDAPTDVTLDVSTDTPDETFADVTSHEAASDGPHDAAGKDASEVPPDATSEAATDAHAVDSGPSCTDGGTPPSPDATYLSDPPATETTTTTGYVLFKQLDAFPNYGATDDAADILYTGDVGSWTFSIPSGTIVSATVVASMVADDGGSAPASDYTFELWSSGCSYESAAGELPHGVPFDSMFSNWVSVTNPAILMPGGSYTVTIQNTSTTGATAWIAIDWIELVVTTM
jgi:hypothetical protein